MQLSDEQHAREAVKILKVLDPLKAHEKIAVLKTATALVENALAAETSLALIANALRRGN